MNNSSLIPLRLMARRLGVPVRWLREEAKAGRLPHLNAGGRILVHPEAVECELTARAASLQVTARGGSHAG